MVSYTDGQTILGPPSQHAHCFTKLSDILKRLSGTMVASVAAGRIHGVASNADLVIVKMRNYARNPRQPDEYLQRGVTLPALQDAWDFVINDVLTKRGNGYTGKSIINMSFGKFTTDS